MHLAQQQGPMTGRRGIDSARKGGQRRAEVRGRDAVATIGRPACGEADYDPEEIEFLKESMNYSAQTGRQFLSRIEVFRLLKKMGYIKLGRPEGAVEVA